MTYTAEQLEDALGILWNLVEKRLTEEDLKVLNIEEKATVIKASIFQELWSYGSGGPVGLGLGRIGGHVVGE